MHLADAFIQSDFALCEILWPGVSSATKLHDHSMALILLTF